MQQIDIINAKIHNLKGINLSIPKNKFIVVTGVSGSGKSSLVFDILHTKGLNNYLEALGMYQDNSGYDVCDLIRGLSPSIAVQQRSTENRNSRSVVGTTTKILNLLAILYAYDGNECIADHNKMKLTPGMFLFNSPYGTCLMCGGRGVVTDYNLEKILPSENDTIEVWHDFAYHYPNKKKENKSYITNRLDQFIHYFNCSYDTPFSQLSSEAKKVFLDYYPNDLTKRDRKNVKLFYFGIRGILLGRLKKIKKDLSDIEITKECPCCKGDRLRESARKVKINGKHIGEVGRMNISELEQWLSGVLKADNLTPFSLSLVREILKKIHFMKVVGLSYLTLYRELPSLSGGETQRLYIMRHLSSKLEGVTYIFDEPTVGLHENEKEILVQSFQKLKDQGNTVIVVEHDERVIKSAEYIIDFGPKAGIYGGNVVYEGDLEHFLECKDSITARYLKSKNRIQKDYHIDKFESIPKLEIRDCYTHNLLGVNLDLPLGGLIGFCGVSGSGKSSLVIDSIIPKLEQRFKVKEGRRASGSLHIIDQKLTSRSDTSCVATYLDVWSEIRKIFASTDDAKKKNYDHSYFSFNSKGTCMECHGSGHLSGYMSGMFFSRQCPVCNGKRFDTKVLDVRYKNRNVDDVLNMSVSDALCLFRENKKITKILTTLESLGMGYILLGQRLTTLSGGEAQRLKLTRELGKESTKECIYILDEPTNGLSYYDIEKLLILLFMLVKKGYAVMIIEHDTYVLSQCDYLVEMGPGGGDRGGNVIAKGTVQEIKENKNSIIGKYLALN